MEHLCYELQLSLYGNRNARAAERALIMVRGFERVKQRLSRLDCVETSLETAGWRAKKPE